METSSGGRAAVMRGLTARKWLTINYSRPLRGIGPRTAGDSRFYGSSSHAAVGLVSDTDRHAPYAGAVVRGKGLVSDTTPIIRVARAVRVARGIGVVGILAELAEIRVVARRIVSVDTAGQCVTAEQCQQEEYVEVLVTVIITVIITQLHGVALPGHSVKSTGG